MKAVILESNRLKFEPLSLKHFSTSYLNWLNDESVNRYLESGGDYTKEKLIGFLKEQEQKDILFWAIHIKASGKHIGNIKIDPINKDNNSGEYGILMGDKEEWGKGYAKEASLTIMDYCFNVIQLDKITLGVIDKNTSALNLYKALGFKNELVIYNYGVYEGEVCNSIRMVKYND